jgi:hypothetical protein
VGEKNWAYELKISLLLENDAKLALGTNLGFGRNWKRIETEKTQPHRRLDLNA